MKWVTSPGSMHDTGCLGLVHWTTQRDGMGREEGGGFRMGNTCIPVADSFWYMAKPIQYCKVKLKKKRKEKQRHYFANIGPSSQGYGFSSGHVWMWELDCEESWARKNWCLWTVVLEKTLESPLNCKEIQPVHSEGDQPWDFFGGNDAEAETPVLWPLHAKSWLLGKDWCWEGLGARGEGDDRGWDGWMVSLTWWMWVSVNSRSWWWTGRPGVLWFMGSQRVGHDWATDLIWYNI